MSDSFDDRLRLGNAVHLATQHIGADTSAERLYADAAAVAEQRFPSPLGTALAAVLIEAAEHRRLSGVKGSLGASMSMMALAVAVNEATE